MLVEVAPRLRQHAIGVGPAVLVLDLGSPVGAQGGGGGPDQTKHEAPKPHQQQSQKNANGSPFHTGWRPRSCRRMCHFAQGQYMYTWPENGAAPNFRSTDQVRTSLPCSTRICCAAKHLLTGLLAASAQSRRLVSAGHPGSVGHRPLPSW